MYTHMKWITPGNAENCAANSINVATYAKRFPHGCWSFLGFGCEKSGTELMSISQRFCAKKELDPDSINHIESEICGSLIPAEIANANATCQSSTSLAQGDLLQEYERKFAEILDDQNLLKLCSDAGFLRKLAKDNSSLHLMKKKDQIK